MPELLIVWAITTICVFLVAYVIRCVRQGRWARPQRMYWRGLLIYGLIAGGVAAFLWQLQASRSVAVPDHLVERASIPERQQ